MESGMEVVPEPSSTPKLPLFSNIIPPMQSSPERSGMLTPPLHTSASVPFRWEEEPGKPRPCTALITTTNTNTNINISSSSTNTNNFCLELPPRLQLMDPCSKMTKMPSPTTVLDGPYLPIVSSSSFRFVRERQGSFSTYSSCGSPDRGQLGAMVLSNSSKERGRGLFGSWGGGGGLGKPKPKPTHTSTTTLLKSSNKKEVGGGSSVFSSSSMDLEDYFVGTGEEEIRGKKKTKTKKMSRITRNGSFSTLSQVRSHFWGSVYEGFKQVLPWKSRKSKKDGFIN